MESAAPEAECVTAESPASGDGDAKESLPSTDGRGDKRRRRLGWSPVRSAVVALAVAGLAIATVGGWFDDQAYHDLVAEKRTHALVEAARQGALNLATIDFTNVRDDVQHILDSSTGAFLQDFRSREPAFTDFVQKAQSKSTGTITEAAVESSNGDEARILVALAVVTSSAGRPPGPGTPQMWRMRVTVQMTSAEVAKMSNVEFVA
jgi:Mce-associated membrane protein